MIRHQDHKFIYNELAAFEFPNGMCFNLHPETCLWEDGFQLMAPDDSFRLVLTFLTVDKSALDFAMEIYEERESVTIVEPMHKIETAGGLEGWATLFEYTDEVIEEITLDLPDVIHSLLNVRFWRRKKPYDQALYEQAKRELLDSVHMISSLERTFDMEVKTKKLTWDELDALFEAFFEQILGKTIQCAADFDEYDYWGVKFVDYQMPIDEIEKVCSLVHANEQERKDAFPLEGESTAKSFGLSIATKILSDLLDCSWKKQFADEDALYLIECISK